MRRMLMVMTSIALGAILGLTVRNTIHVGSQTPFAEGTFVMGQDGSTWIVGGGLRYPIVWTIDDQNALSTLSDGPSVSSVADIASIFGLTTPPSRTPAPMVPAPMPTRAPLNDAGLTGQTISDACGLLSRARFTVTVERAELSINVMGEQASGQWVIIIANVTNNGNVPDDPFQIIVLRDERGRRFEPLGSTDFPPYFNLRRQLGVRSYVDDIQPGLSARVLFVFQVPLDVQRLQLAPAETTRCRA
jgi:hypothetical protein